MLNLRTLMTGAALAALASAAQAQPALQILAQGAPELSAPVAPPSAEAVAVVPLDLKARGPKTFKLDEVEARYNAATSKAPTVEQALGNWVLEARLEKGGLGVYDREGLTNKAGEGGGLFFVSDDDPYVADRGSALAYVMGINYADGNSGLEQGYPTAASGDALKFSEILTRGTRVEQRDYACRLVEADRLLCRMDRSVALSGIAGMVKLQGESYSAYYGFARVRTPQIP